MDNRLANPPATTPVRPQPFTDETTKTLDSSAVVCEITDIQDSSAMVCVKLQTL